ncbi:MAG TPA: outer membrane beta-barrel domain-containing protein [Kofleriaceae bacterium]|nr:outer membrane beta-barrel domain-containing protein [Kofleriaceae bacterium]
MASTALAQSRGKRAPGKAPAAGKAPAPSKSPAPAKGSGGDAGEIEMESDDAKKPGAGSGSNDVNPDEIDMGESDKQGDLSADLNATAQNGNAIKATPIKKTPLSWQDIVVVIRKPFLKVRRTELLPFVGTTMNDNMIRHYTLGGELAYYLTDVLAVGVEGLYYVHSFREPFDLVARQARRLPTINEYNWSAALDFHYVPVYGKFAVLDHRLVTWEAFFTAGIGAGQSQVIPRDTRYPGFTNLLIMPNVGASMRFFLSKWLTVSLGVRDYVFFDHFEPKNRTDVMYATGSEAKAHADGSLINNVMFQIGVSFWVPTTFEYTTFR